MLNISFGGLGNNYISSQAGEASTVPANTTTTVLTISGSTFNRVTQISCSGECYAKWLFLINNQLKDVKRTGPSRNADFIFNFPYKLESADVLDVKVIHYYSGKTFNFQTSIYGYIE